MIVRTCNSRKQNSFFFSKLSGFALRPFRHLLMAMSFPFRWWSDWNVKLNNHFSLVRRLRISGALQPFSPYAFIAWRVTISHLADTERIKEVDVIRIWSTLWAGVRCIQCLGCEICEEKTPISLSRRGEEHLRTSLLEIRVECRLFKVKITIFNEEYLWALCKTWFQ